MVSLLHRATIKNKDIRSQAVVYTVKVITSDKDARYRSCYYGPLIRKDV